MPSHFEMFNQFITKYVEFTESELVDLNNKCNRVEFTKGDIIVKAGDTQKNLYFITKGIIRNYVDNYKGEIKIYNFRSEGMTVSGYALYNHEEKFKALVNVECLEDCIMIKVPLNVINYVINHTKLGDRLGRFMAEAHVVEMLHYAIQRDTKTIIEQLENIDNIFPNIHQRVPQYMIASYLGITPVHLSNLKKSRKPNKE